MRPLWSLQLLGDLQLRHDDRVIGRFRTQRAAELLAYLARFSDRPHPREALVELLWPEDRRSAGLRKLTVALSSLRCQLEGPGVPAGAVIQADRFTVRLNPEAVVTDVARFEAALHAARRAPSAGERTARLAAALEAYRGEFLPGCFEEWCLAERDRLRGLYEAALGQQIALLEVRGELEDALDCARRLVDSDPLREGSGRELVRLLAAVGQPDAALREYGRLERRYREELDEPPGQALRDLAESIRRQLPAGPPPPAPPAPPLAPGGAGEPPPGPSLAGGTVTLLLAGPAAPLAQDGDPPVEGKRALAEIEAELARRGTVLHEGEALASGFALASEALRTALALRRRAGGSAAWLRLALHTGEVEIRRGRYAGLTLDRARGVLAAAAGGELLCSEATACLLPPELRSRARFDEARVGGPEGVGRLFQVLEELAPPALPPAPPAGLPASHLPVWLTRFVGGEGDLDRLEALLRSPEARLVTLTGPGGSGKTRLGVEAARRVVKPSAGAAWFVPLADLCDARHVPDALRRALRLPPVPHLDPLEQVIEALGRLAGPPGERRPLLLVLDNFEQLLDAPGAAAHLSPGDGEGSLHAAHEPLACLLRQVPGLTCLVTSRRPLRLVGEKEFPVPPLPVPEARPASRCHPAAPEGLLLNPAVQLYVERAQDALPYFQLTPRNAAAVAELCRRLDGLPLALEMTAARVRTLSPAQALAQLDHRFDLLVSRRRDLPERHRSLHHCIEWSYHLLTEELRQLFARLSVFRGGWTAEAAAAVCEAPRAETGLAELVESSLVLQAEDPAGRRYRLLETLREFAREQLSPAERKALARRHLEYYLALAERAERGLRARARATWLGLLEAERDNTRAALAWSLAHPATGDAALRLAGSLGDYWYSQGRVEEGREALAAALAGPAAHSPTRARAKALYALGRLDGPDGRSGRSLVAESLALRRKVGDLAGVAESLQDAAMHQWSEGDYAAARPLAEESVALARRLADPPLLARALMALGNVVEGEGDETEAWRVYQEALEAARESGNPRSIGVACVSLGSLALRRGQQANAAALYRESLARGSELGDTWLVALARERLGDLALQAGDAAAARALLEESLRTWRERHDGGAARTASKLGSLAAGAGDAQAARRFYREAVSWCARLGRPEWAAASLEGLAALLARDPAGRRPREQAATLFGAAARLRAAADPRRPHAEPLRHQEDEAALCASLPRRRFRKAWDEGHALPWEQTLTLALHPD